MARHKPRSRYSDAELSAARKLHREGFSSAEIGAKLKRAYPANILHVAGVDLGAERQARIAKKHDDILRLFRQGHARADIAEQLSTNVSLVSMVLHSTVPIAGQKEPLLSADEITNKLNRRKRR